MHDEDRDDSYDEEQLDEEQPDEEQPDDDADEWDVVPGPGTGSWGAPLTGALAGAVTTLVLVLAWSMLSAEEDEPAPELRPAPASAGSAEDDETGAPERRGPTRLTRCVSAERSLQGPLAAARPALDQWQVHVDAMNQLVVGEITLQQATDFWERTRLGAERRVDRFDDALQDLRRRGVDCPDPALLAPGSRALPACAREVSAHVRALRVAEVSVSTWEEHIHHMDMLRLGQMTPEEATRMWLASWRRGARDLDTYADAARASMTADGCSRVGASG